MQLSETVSTIATALTAFQGEVKNPVNKAKAQVPTKGGGQYSYTYATLPDILTAVRPLLAKHGLSVFQSAVSNGGGVGVETLLMHTSGEWIKTDPLLLPLQMATPQGAGSAVTYARRYALSAVLGISSEDDDDGQRAGGGGGEEAEEASAARSRSPVRAVSKPAEPGPFTDPSADTPADDEAAATAEGLFTKPTTEASKPPNFTRFWTAVAKLGFTPVDVHKAAGVSTVASWTQPQLDKLLADLTAAVQKAGNAGAE